MRAAAASAAAAAHSMSGKRTRSNRDSATGVSALGKDVTGMAVVDSAMLRRAVTSLVAGHFALPDGKLLVAKVFLGNFGECGNSGRERSRSADTEGNGDGGSSNDDEHNDSEARSSEDSASDSEDSSAYADENRGGLGAGTASVRPRDFPNYDSVYNMNASDPKQRSGSFLTMLSYCLNI